MITIRLQVRADVKILSRFSWGTRWKMSLTITSAVPQLQELPCRGERWFRRGSWEQNCNSDLSLGTRERGRDPSEQNSIITGEPCAGIVNGGESLNI